MSFLMEIYPKKSIFNKYTKNMKKTIKTVALMMVLGTLAVGC